MRLLMLHVDYFASTITEKGRSKIVEEFDPSKRTTRIDEGLLVLASVERADEVSREAVSQNASVEIAKLADKLKVRQVVLHSFAHLFADLGSPEAAIEVLKRIQDILVGRGFQVERTPFGWFNTLELRAKGHPISRVSRIVTA